MITKLLRALPAAAVLVTLLGGPPWALVRVVGWPLPDHLPSWTEIETVLFGPMTAAFLLDALACLTWLLWSLFALYTARSALEIVHTACLPDLSVAGPVRRAAAGIVGAIVISLLDHRAGVATERPPITARGTGSEVVATAPVVEKPMTVTVQAPDAETGVHDSLWRIAERTLGDGTRWPEIFAINEGKPQPDGGTFTCPSLIYPGEELLLPIATPVLPVQPPPKRPPLQEPPDNAEPPKQPQPAASERGVRWGDELFVGLGLAAAISAAMVVARHKQRRRYRPGSGHRADIPVAPVVYQLRLAHQRLSTAADASELQGRGAAVLPVGVRDGREIALDLAKARGLGLLGDGAAAAARALLITAVATTPAGSQVIIPAADLATLVGAGAEQRPLPSNVQVEHDLDAAMEVLEAETLARTNQRERAASAPLVLVARPPAQQQRLQAVLDRGAHVGIAGVLLGQWTPGATAYVSADGTVTTTNPGYGEQLRGTAMFRTGEHDTTDLLALLHRADPVDTAAHSQTDGTPIPIETESSTSDREPSTEAQQHGIELKVLGRFQLLHNGQDITASVAPKQREILVHLALHPDGVRRDSLVADIWPDIPSSRPSNTFHATLSQFRRALRASTNDAVGTLTTHQDGHYRLDPHRVDVDLWRLWQILDKTGNRVSADIIEVYRGDLVEELSSEWILAPRESLRRDTLDRMNGTVSFEKDANVRLSILEHMRRIDPYNEIVYRQIMRVQRELDRRDSIPRTGALLVAKLAEIGEEPSSETVALMRAN